MFSKGHHRQQASEGRPTPYQRPESSQRLGQSSKTPIQRNRSAVPTLVQKQGADAGQVTLASDDTPSLEDMSIVRNKEISVTDEDGRTVKVERAENSDSYPESPSFSKESAKFPPALERNHTQACASRDSGNLSDSNNDNEETSCDNDDSANTTSIKIEPITENEMELEITGVELGNNAQLPDTWGQGQAGFVAAGTSGDESLNQSTDAGYSK